MLLTQGLEHNPAVLRLAQECSSLPLEPALLPDVGPLLGAALRRQACEGGGLLVLETLGTDIGFFAQGADALLDADATLPYKKKARFTLKKDVRSFQRTLMERMPLGSDRQSLCTCQLTGLPEPGSQAPVVVEATVEADQNGLPRLELAEVRSGVCATALLGEKGQADCGQGRATTWPENPQVEEVLKNADSMFGKGASSGRQGAGTSASSSRAVGGSKPKAGATAPAAPPKKPGFGDLVAWVLAGVVMAMLVWAAAVFLFGLPVPVYVGTGAGVLLGWSCYQDDVKKYKNSQDGPGTGRPSTA